MLSCLKAWAKTSFAELLMKMFVSHKDARGSVIAEQVCKNEITIKIAHHHDIIITSAGREDEFYGLLCVYLASRGRQLQQNTCECVEAKTPEDGWCKSISSGHWEVVCAA